MIKFDTINGQLCIMLEKPDAINEFSRTPCVIACKCGGLKKYYILDFPPSNPSMSMLAEGFEIIGYPVADGSAGWALYQMMQGKSVQGAYWGDSVIAEKCVNNYMVKRQRESYEQQNKHHPVVVCANTFIAKAEPMGWQLYEPEPVPQYKVGDWVEYRLDSQAFYGEISEIRDHAYYLSVTTEDIPSDQARAIYLSNIVRKLDPSEVVIHIGCLSGTVDFVKNDKICPYSTINNICHFVLQNPTSGYWSVICFKELDAPTRNLVESLLKAQEEE